MKIKTFGLTALLMAVVLTLVGCGKTDAPVDENVEMANPASVYCEENGGTLVLEDGAGLCVFPDGTYCEEWAYQRGECQPGEILFNTVGEESLSDAASEIYSDENLTAAKDAIMNVIDNEWEVKVESVELAYAGDDLAASSLEYCQSLNPEVTECAVFTSNFHIPEQDVMMAGAFEPNTDIDGWNWYLSRNAAGEWEVLSNGFG